MTLEEAEVQLDPQRFMHVNRQYIVSAAAVEKLSAWFLGKLRVHLKGYPNEEIIHPTLLSPPIFLSPSKVRGRYGDTYFVHREIAFRLRFHPRLGLYLRRKRAK